MTELKHLVNKWAQEQMKRLHTIRASLRMDLDDVVNFSIEGNTLELMIPAGLITAQDANDVAVMVTCVHVVDDGLEDMVGDLNEKLERRKKVGQEGVDEVLEMLLRVLETFHSRLHADVSSDDDEYQHEEPEVDYAHYYEKGMLHQIAADASLRCLASFKEASPGHVTAWFAVIEYPKDMRMQLRVALAGLIETAKLANALGFVLNSPLEISLHFNRNLWVKQEFSVSEFDVEKVAATQFISELATEEKCLNYSLETLIPEMVYGYLEFHRVKVSGGSMSYKRPTLTKMDRLLQEQLDSSARDNIDNPILGLCSFIASRLRSLPRWCPVCWNALPSEVSELLACNSDFCLYRFEELGLGCSVLGEVRQSSAVVEMQIALAKAAASAQGRDVFEPYPSFLLEKKEIRGRAGWFNVDGSEKYNYVSNKRLHLLQAVLSSLPKIEAMQVCVNEAELKKFLSVSWTESHYWKQHAKEIERCPNQRQLPYDLMRFILSTNRLSLQFLSPSERLPIAVAKQFAVLFDAPEKEAYYEKCRTEGRQSVFFAFHGSDVQNWYSILRNGLRSMSQTAYMSRGAAHGKGIYTAPSMATSAGYAGSSASLRCIAICEVMTNEKLSGNNSFCTVIPKAGERDVAIRYLMLSERGDFDNSAVISNGTKLKEVDLRAHHAKLRESFKERKKSEYDTQKRDGFRSCIESSSSVASPQSTPSTSSDEDIRSPKRQRGEEPSSRAAHTIMKEFRKIMNQISIAENGSLLSKIRVVIPDEKNFAVWKVTLDKNMFESSPLLMKDLVRLESFGTKATVQLEVRFPGDFPFLPPFVRVVSPKFVSRTGHVTVGGSICMELLTKSGWSAACDIESLLVQIVNAMIEGDGRVDFHSRAQEAYSFAAARSAFDRVARDHGWEK